MQEFYNRFIFDTRCYEVNKYIKKMPRDIDFNADRVQLSKEDVNYLVDTFLPNMYEKTGAKKNNSMFIANKLKSLHEPVLSTFTIEATVLDFPAMFTVRKSIMPAMEQSVGSQARWFYRDMSEYLNRQGYTKFVIKPLFDITAMLFFKADNKIPQEVLATLCEMVAIDKAGVEHFIDTTIHLMSINGQYKHKLILSADLTDTEEKHYLFISSAMVLCDIVMLYLKNMPTKVVEVNSTKVEATKHIGNKQATKSKHNTKSIIKLITIKRVGVQHKTDGETGKHNMTCPAWGVRGHYRTYKSGKKVWIEPYSKGKDRGNIEKYKGKNYKL